MATPFELEQQRQQEAAAAEKQSQLSSGKNVDSTLIQNATPDNLKAKGTAKLPILIFGLGTQIPQIIQPSLINLIQKYIPNPDVCPDEKTLKELIEQRNNIVQSLNNIGNKINQLGISITGVSNFLTITLGLLSTLDSISIAASSALKVLPPPTVPGAVPAALNDIQTIIRKITFDKEGNSKLSKTQSILNGSALIISIIGTYVLTVSKLIQQIDIFITKCSVNEQTTPLSPEINQIIETQLQSESTQNEISYNGFIIDIEEVPFSPTVTRRRAIGKTSQGIKLIQTELSFTTDNQTLINELKFIIDRDNLKAY
jgi:hypothetical protein